MDICDWDSHGSHCFPLVYPQLKLSVLVLIVVYFSPYELIIFTFKHSSYPISPLLFLPLSSFLPDLFHAPPEAAAPSVLLWPGIKQMKDKQLSFPEINREKGTNLLGKPDEEEKLKTFELSWTKLKHYRLSFSIGIRHYGQYRQ